MAGVNFAAVKGGLSRQMWLYMLKMHFAKTGKRVIMSNTDENNSLSFYYSDNEVQINRAVIRRREDSIVILTEHI